MLIMQNRPYDLDNYDNCIFKKFNVFFQQSNNEKFGNRYVPCRGKGMALAENLAADDKRLKVKTCRICRFFNGVKKSV